MFGLNVHVVLHILLVVLLVLDPCFLHYAVT